MWAFVAVAVFAFIILFSLLGWTVEWLWMGELGYRGVFWRIRLTQAGLFVAAFVPALAYFGINGALIARIADNAEAQGSGWMPRPTSHTKGSLGGRAALILIPAIIAFLVAVSFAGAWDELIRLTFATPFGRAEPILGRDAGFYVFTLPFLDVVQNTVVLVTLVGTGAHLFVYYQLGYLRSWKTLDDRSQRRILLVVSINAALFLVAWGWGYYLDRFALFFGSGGAVFGPGYADVKVVLPALGVMAGASIALVAVLVLGMVKNRVQWPLLGAASYVVLGVLAILAVPALFQQFVVKPNELDLETPFLEHNIAFTRQAFDLEDVEERSYPAITDLTVDQIRQNEDTLRNVRLWDWRPLHQTFRQLQEIRLYYEFYNIDVDRYVLDGEVRQVLLSGRELANSLPSQADTWVNRYLQYTHGYGLAMSLAAHEDAAGEGVPTLIVKDLPPVAEGGLRVEQPAIYYGEEMAGHRVVSTTIEEFHYPSGDANVYAHYDGSGGVPLSSYWRRLLFAWNRLDVNLLISSYITPDSRIQIWRSVQERVAKIAPFLKLDEDPYLVVSDGRLFWIQDAYTVSDTYPYSEPINGGPNYIRNPVKVVVDAYEGAVDFYMIDETDPIIQSYRAAFPSLFKPLSEMPEGLKRHLRYPRDLFGVQVRMYKRYHMQIPRVFYNNEDLWTLPEEKYGGRLAPMHPYYILMRLPGETQLQFLLMIPLTPAGRDNMIAWMGARSDFPGYGELIVYKFPKERLIYGPIQIEALIDQDTVISRQLSLWDQRGSKVIRGNLLVIPIEHSILYVEPVYLIAESRDVPQLKRVIVAYNNRVEMKPTLAEAIEAVFGAGLSRDVRMPPGEGLSVGVLGRLKESVDRAERALQEGDWPAFGRAMGDLKRLLEEAGAEAPAL